MPKLIYLPSDVYWRRRLNVTGRVTTAGPVGLCLRYFRNFLATVIMRPQILRRAMKSF